MIKIEKKLPVDKTDKAVPNPEPIYRVFKIGPLKVEKLKSKFKILKASDATMKTWRFEFKW